jgi:hypothetical protein
VIAASAQLECRALAGTVLNTPVSLSSYQTWHWHRPLTGSCQQCLICTCARLSCLQPEPQNCSAAFASASARLHTDKSHMWQPG